MRYEIDKVGEAGKIYLEQKDLLQVQPCKDGVHAVELSVRHRRQYQNESVFEWQGNDSKELKLRLVARQVEDLVEQERSEQTRFCADCYDYGKVDGPPKSCTKCQLLAACHKAGQGDFRKVRPPRQPGRPGLGYGFIMMTLVLLWWWTLCQWANAATRTTALQEQLQGCRQTPRQVTQR